MNKNDLILQSIQLSIDRIALEIAELKQESIRQNKYAALPEWIELEQALALKRGVSKKCGTENVIDGGASITTYRQLAFLQPCCGLNYKLVGGRKCWKKEDIIEWLMVTDEELKRYAEKWRVVLPAIYKKRGNTI